MSFFLKKAFDDIKRGNPHFSGDKKYNFLYNMLNISTKTTSSVIEMHNENVEIKKVLGNKS